MTTDLRSEKELIQDVVRGDVTAFDRLMERLEPEIRRFLKGALRERPDVSVDEALHEVRIYLFRRLDRYDPAYPPIAFAIGLSKNIVRRFLYRRPDGSPGIRDDDSDDAAGTEDLSVSEMEHLPVRLRRVMGEGRFESPDGPPPPSRVFLEMIEIFLRYGGYPHQQVAFGYSLLLWGKSKKESKGQPEDGATRLAKTMGKVPVTGDPDRVVREVGPRELSPSTEDMLADLRVEAHLEDDFLRRVRRPLDERLLLTGRELFARDRASLQQFEELTGSIVGGTRLVEYFGRDGRKSVADWTHGVKERIKKAFLAADPARTPELRV